MHRFKEPTLSEEVLSQQHLGLNILSHLMGPNGSDRSNGSFKKYSFTSLHGREAG
jgi:hypothetical protein